MSVGDEFRRLAADDELCAEVRQAVEGGDEDALRRLGFGGFGGYVQRLSEIMSDSVTDGLDLSADDFGAIMGEVASPARYAHHLVNEAGTAIQSAKDKPLGIHIKPLEPEFDDDALCGTVGKAVSMDTPEQAVETLADGLSYAVKKAGNDFVKKNAGQRSRAGFEVTVKRSGSSKCCEWCAARIGSWALKNAPDGVFGCHAKCSCVVEYTSSTGAVSQRRGTGRFVEVEYQPPHVMTHEEAREKGGFDEPKRLTGGGNGGIIYSDNSGEPIQITDEAITKVSKLNVFSDETNERIQEESKHILEIAKDLPLNTEVGYSLPLDLSNGKTQIGEPGEGAVAIPKLDVLYISIHNHPSNESFSIRDLDNFANDKNCIAMFVVGNNGKLFAMKKDDSIDNTGFFEYIMRRQFGFLPDVPEEEFLKGAVKYGYKYYE